MVQQIFHKNSFKPPSPPTSRTTTRQISSPNDTAYGKPIFTVFGCATQCPGDTRTEAIESALAVSLYGVEYFCNGTYATITCASLPQPDAQIFLNVIVDNVGAWGTNEFMLTMAHVDQYQPRPTADGRRHGRRLRH